MIGGSGSGSRKESSKENIQLVLLAGDQIIHWSAHDAVPRGAKSMGRLARSKNR